MEAKILFAALAFAAKRHGGQRRKGKSRMPYINHPIDVADILCDVGSVKDIHILTAAILHDTIEDTETSSDEIRCLFGPEVHALVMEVSDDKSLPRELRRKLQIKHAPHISIGGKLIKIADKISNIRDLSEDPPAAWSESEIREYRKFAKDFVDSIRGTNKALEDDFDKYC